MSEISEFNFADEHGDAWDVKVTGGTIKRVKNMMAGENGNPVNIIDIINLKTDTARRFSSDVEFQVDLLWAVCHPQAVIRNVSAEQFAERLAGDAFGEAINRLLDAVVNFTPNAAVRANLRSILETMRREEKSLTDQISQTVQSAEMKEGISALVKTYTGYSCDAAASAESTQTE